MTRPVAASERIEILDALRGLAIFGILMVNLPLMHRPMTAVLINPGWGDGLLESAAEAFVRIFFEGKFYVLFSALFGYGFHLFLNKPSGSPEENLRLFKRRLFFLLLFGVAHILLLWPGDILVMYALFGFLLLLFRNSSARRQLIWAAIFISLPILITLLSYGMLWLGSMMPESAEAIERSMSESAAEMQALYDGAARAYSSGSYREGIYWRWQEYLALLPGIVFFYPTVIGVFILGKLMAQKKLLSEAHAQLPFWRKALRLGLGIGMPFSLFYAYAMHQAPPGDQGSGWYLLGTTSHIVGGITLCLAYVAALVLYFQRSAAHFWRRHMAAVGRMALSNYILHSLLAVLLFHGVGLGLYGKIEGWQSILLAIAIFTAQIPLSTWWLSRFRFGPLEWLWRTLTYGRLQSMSRSEKAGKAQEPGSTK